jgi:hypothetical protein
MGIPKNKENTIKRERERDIDECYLGAHEIWLYLYTHI